MADMARIASEEAQIDSLVADLVPVVRKHAPKSKCSSGTDASLAQGMKELDYALYSALWTRASIRAFRAVRGAELNDPPLFDRDKLTVEKPVRRQDARSTAELLGYERPEQLEEDLAGYPEREYKIDCPFGAELPLGISRGWLAEVWYDAYQSARDLIVGTLAWLWRLAAAPEVIQGAGWVRLDEPRVRAVLHRGEVIRMLAVDRPSVGNANTEALEGNGLVEWRLGPKGTEYRAGRLLRAIEKPKRCRTYAAKAQSLIAPIVKADKLTVRIVAFINDHPGALDILPLLGPTWRKSEREALMAILQQAIDDGLVIDAGTRNERSLYTTSSGRDYLASMQNANTIRTLEDSPSKASKSTRPAKLRRHAFTLPGHGTRLHTLKKLLAEHDGQLRKKDAARAIYGNGGKKALSHVQSLIAPIVKAGEAYVHNGIITSGARPAELRFWKNRAQGNG